ncbi:MAG: hypothetical protein WBJ77_01250, partial [Bacillota bacterium]
PLFDLESGFDRDERLKLMSSFLQSQARITDWVTYSRKTHVRLGVNRAIEEYLSGSVSREQFEQRIYDALKSHTNQ